MTIHPQFARGSTETQVLRQQAGRWLRALRERVGLSQKELAHAVGFDYYTFISQLESGRGPLPPGQYIAFATALQIPLHEFVKTLLRYYDPLTHYALFDTEPSVLDESIPVPGVEDKAPKPMVESPVAESATKVASLEERLAKLEGLLSRLS